MANKQHLQKVLSDALPVLCRNGLPPYVSFRVEAMIGITIMDEGADNSNCENITLVCFQQTVSDSGTIIAQSGFPPAVPSNGGASASQTSSKRPKQPAAATVSVKQEYLVETAIKQEYNAEGYATEPGSNQQVADTMAGYEEVEYIGDGAEYAEEEYYEDGAQYYENGEGYDNFKYEPQDDGYMGSLGDNSYMPTEYMQGDEYGHTAASQMPKYSRGKATRGRQSAAGGQGRSKKLAGTPRGAVQKPKTARTANDQANAIAVGGGGRGSKDAGYSKVVQDVLDSAVQQSMQDGGESCVCHICSATLKNAKSLRHHIRGTHLAIKAHRCNICGESFQWPMQVFRHKKRIHGTDGNQLMIFQ